jgi:hypothetical protein
MNQYTFFFFCMKTKTLRVFSRLKSSSKYTFAVLFGMILMVGGSTYAALSNGTPQNLADGEVLMSENWNAVSSGVNELDNRTAPITNSGGNIGIGRSDPMQKLDVNGSIRISEDIIHTEATPIDIRATDANGSLRVYTGNDKLGLAQASSGNVGIGTESPGAKLDVAGEGYFGSGNKLKIHENSGGLSIQGTLATDDSQKKNLFLNAWGGNVGIGTTNPQEKLVVNGKVRAERYCNLDGNRCLDFPLSYTYSWEISNWSQCSAGCDGGIKTRTVSCLRSDGVFVSDASCPTPKPNEEEACNTQACTYDWQTSAWSGCTATCGGGTQTRTTNCYRSDGVAMSDTFCTNKPIISQTCNTQACPTPIPQPTAQLCPYRSGAGCSNCPFGTFTQGGSTYCHGFGGGCLYSSGHFMCGDASGNGGYSWHMNGY